MKKVDINELFSPEILNKINSCKSWHLKENPYTQWKSLQAVAQFAYDICVHKEKKPIFDLIIDCQIEEQYTIESTFVGVWTIQRLYNGKLNLSSIRVFETLDEFAEYCVDTLYRHEIRKDDFDGKYHVIWKAGGLEFYGLNIFQNRHIRFAIDADACGYCLKFIWSTDWRKKKEMGIGDTISILFENNQRVDLVAKTKPAKVCNYHDDLCYVFNIDKTFISNLANQNIIAMRFNFSNGDTPFVQDSKNIEKEYQAALFRAWIRKNIQLFEEVGYKAGEVILEEPSKLEGACSVYLMFDEANGYYKIGISNHPEYREHTLQSEKPTITLLKAKEYPSRAIAEAFEAALHKTYDSKRLRGEWFKLDATDVGLLMKALS